jgi:uncharacterized protein
MKEGKPMSEYINNSQYRQAKIREILRQIHEGKPLDEVRKYFADTFAGVSASEISEAEKALISEGLPVEEVQRLCDIHAAVFKGSIQDIYNDPENPVASRATDHPAASFKKENRRIERIISQEIKPWLSKAELNEDDLAGLRRGIEHLSMIDGHYQRKEYALFPYLEKHGITAPPKVMWGVDDQIRAMLKELQSSLASRPADPAELHSVIGELLRRVSEMIFKEENILLPMMLENLTPDEWDSLAAEFRMGGSVTMEDSGKAGQSAGSVMLPSGAFQLDELTAMLNALPFDITFVDRDGHVKYFSEGQDRIFVRTRSIIGRHVLNCHPPASVHVVEKIVDDFKQGKKDHEDFWIKMGDRFVLIRYFAVRGENKEYLGVLEVTQNIRPIQEISGEKRLMSDL